MRRLTILLAALGIMVLVPAVGAQAEGLGTTTVEIGGAGKGSVSGKGGFLSVKEEISQPAYETSPPIECEYVSPGPAGGICTATSGKLFKVFEGSFLVAHAAKGSEFAGWTLGPGTVDGSEGGLCRESAGPESEAEKEWAEFNNGEANFQGGQACFIQPENEEYFQEKAISASVLFEPCAEASLEIGSGIPSCEGLGGGPTNLRTLTITKSANGPGGTGTVSSKPKGIKCGATCEEAVASEYKSTPVTLTAKPTLTSAFVKWVNAKEGGACDESTNPICTVPMAEDESLEAVFSGTSKTINPTEALTVSKGESTGKGTVKGPGLGCEAECTQTVVLFQGPITEPKFKAGKTVLLKQAPAFGSEFIGWSGCESEPEGNCQVVMEEAKEVTAEYEALPGKVLTVNKEYAKGNGSVSSKPKGIKCGTTCTQAVAQMPEDAKVELVAKPLTGTFLKWEGGDCEGSTNPVCVVKMDTNETTKAIFSDPGKAIAEAKTLTVEKEGSGYGTVKAAGLTCEALCSSTLVLYQGPITSPKFKAGKTVILKAAAAPGSQKVVWSGCDSETEAGECVVEMDEDHSVSATFDELE